ncbi:MAG: SDR family oxidoreductase [Candidatus Omnitrophota bacterium]|nr:SDR family oxidoreductase [Candidatus Omnitrophota bacterium]
MSRRHSYRTVLITGATSDIGREIALRFAREGWDIVCHYFSSEEKANRLKQALKKYNISCHLLKADFLSRAQLMNFIERIKKIDIDTLVNNAGTYTASRHFSKLTISDIENTFMVNVFAPMLIAINIFDRMKEKYFGRIVSISSISAKYGGSCNSMHYASSKLALEGLTKNLAREGARYNILVNTIRPGVIKTSFHKKFPKDMKKRIAMIPLKKMGVPEDIADMAYHLGGDKNNFITNEIITISGGE